MFSDKTIGIISPTYDWELPSVVKEFLEKASFQTEYLYYVASYGTMPGASTKGQLNGSAKEYLKAETCTKATENFWKATADTKPTALRILANKKNG